METLHNGFTLRLCHSAFPLSTDSVLLSDFIKLHREDRVLDLGSGCGTLGLLLCAAHPDCRVTGMEIDPPAHKTALENISENGLSNRMESICADLRQARQLLPGGSFHCCVSNPPYFTGGPDAKLTAARREDLCSMEELFHAAAWAVKYGGDFYMVHRPERFAEICACANKVGMEPKRLCTVRHDPEAAISLVLVQCRKGAKPGLKWEELCLFASDGSPTDAYRNIYHL